MAAQAHAGLVVRHRRLARRAAYSVVACAVVASSCGPPGQDAPVVAPAASESPISATPVRASCPPDSDSLFPDDFFEQESGRLPAPATADLADRHLRAAGWPRLWCGSVSEPVFRLVWAPSFGPAVLVEVTRTAEDWAVRAVAFADPSRRDDRFAVVRRIETRASLDDGDDIPGWLRQADFWSAPPLVGPTRFDGVVVLIEGRSAGGYHLIDRVFTEEDFLGETVRAFLRLSGLPMPSNAEKRTSDRFLLNIR